MTTSTPDSRGGDARLVFDESIEGMFLKGHAHLLSPQVKAAIREAGIDLDAKLKPSYPAAVVNEATRRFRRLAYASEPDDMKAYTAIGAATVDGYFGTIMGKALATVLKLINFKRLIDRLPSSLKSGNNYSEASLTWVGDTEALLRVGDVEPHPGINRGVLHRALSHWFAGKGVEVEVHQLHPPGCTYRITFQI